jgi:hypothetical protein
MKDRDFEQERQARQRENDDDWDWYYYEYRYVPYAYSPYRRNQFDRNNYGRDYEHSNRDYEWRQRNRYGSEYDYDYDYGTEPYGGLSYGRYSGVGPRGYRRSDDRIKDDVNDRLTWHGYIDATDIQVEVNDGVVTLKGLVENRRQKRMAEDAAESIPGVEDVENQLKLRNQNWSRGESGMSGINRQQVRPGMEVIGRDGQNVGEVKEVRSSDFLVDRAMARDIYIPFNACQIANGQIRLNVRADEVDNQDWEMPELFDTESETSQRTQKRR